MKFQQVVAVELGSKTDEILLNQCHFADRINSEVSEWMS